MIPRRFAVSIFMILTCSSSYAAKSYTSGRIGLYPTEASGDLYSTNKSTYTTLEGDVTYAMNSKWGLKLGGALSLGGEILAVNVGATYHFVPVVWESLIVGEWATVSRYPLWIPYVTGGISLVRTQLPMVRKDGSQQDIVLAALIGPSMSLGTLYAMSEFIYLHGEVTMRYGFGPSLLAGMTGASVGLALVIP